MYVKFREFNLVIFDFLLYILIVKEVVVVGFDIVCFCNKILVFLKVMKVKYMEEVLVGYIYFLKNFFVFSEIF